MTLQHKTILLVGGSSGIGLATAQLALNEGAHVVIASRSPEKAKAVLGDQIETIALDMAQEQQVKAFFASYPGTFDHILISSVSPDTAPIQEENTESARKVFDIKYWGSYYVVKYGIAKLAERGSITFVSGVVAFKAMAGAATMAAVNSAVVGLANTLALELAPRRVNVVSPGITKTPAWNGMPEQERTNFFASIAGQLPVGKVGEPADLAQGILSLMNNPFITGTVLHVDGGHRLI